MKKDTITLTFEQLQGLISDEIQLAGRYVYLRALDNRLSKKWIWDSDKQLIEEYAQKRAVEFVEQYIAWMK